MFETLFSYPSVLRRHREGPLASERAAYLKVLADHGAARRTLLRQACYCLCIACEMQRWPQDHRFNHADIETVAASWAARQVTKGRATTPRWPRENFRSIAAHFLSALGRVIPASAPPGRYDKLLDDFITAQGYERDLTPTTCQTRRWHIRQFLSYLDRQGCALEGVTADAVDAYFQHLAQRWSRVSLRSTATALRAWFYYCERGGQTRPGLAASILAPRIYRQEAVPLGPTWDQVSRMITGRDGKGPLQLRDRAILLLLAVYGLRSGEVRRLQLEDIDWQKEQIHVVRSKSLRRQTLPLEPTVGNAIIRYLRQGRPRSNNRSLFLTSKAPFRPLSGGALYSMVCNLLSRVAGPTKGRGPHALRHACARHLVAAGFGLKQIGDHLGHQSPDTTRIYAKVDLASLRRVVLEDLGGLA